MNHTLIANFQEMEAALVQVFYCNILQFDYIAEINEELLN